MASRGIANMHLFFEMKNKFPELPEDLIRQYVHQCSEDQEKCLQLLNKECEVHGYSKNPFAEFPVSYHSSGSNTTNTGMISISATNGFDSKFTSNRSIPQEQMRLQTVQHPLYFYQELSSPQKTSVVSNKCTFSHVKILQSPDILKDPSTSFSQEICSVSCASGDKKTSITNNRNRNSPISSHNLEIQVPHTASKCIDKGKILFSTTEEQHILPLSSNNAPSKTFNSSSNKRHMVKLNISPTFPYHQPHEAYNVCGNSSTTCSSQTRKHTTSVNLQLRLPSSDNRPVSVIATPISIQNTKGTGDFDSHFHISISSNCASFTARTLQKSPVSQCSVLLPTVSSVHHSVFSQPKRPNILNLQLPSSHQASSKILSPERRNLGKKCYPFSKPCAGQLRSSVLSEIPETPEGSKSEWLHYLPSPYQNDEFFKHYFPTSGQKQNFTDVQERTFHHYASSLDEKQNYVHAILAHQKAKLEMLHTEILNVKKIHAQLQIEIGVMEKKISGKQIQFSKHLQFEDIQKLKEENRNLKIECDCLIMEVNICNVNKVPSAITGQDFYSNIFTGPIGPAPSIPAGNEEIQCDENSLPETVKSSKIVMKTTEEKKGNKWNCKHCASANHQASNICEFCEQSRLLDCFDSGSNPRNTKDSAIGPLCEDKSVIVPRRTIGSVQISVTQNRSSTKGLKLQLTHRMHR